MYIHIWLYIYILFYFLHIYIYIPTSVYMWYACIPMYIWENYMSLSLLLPSVTQTQNPAEDAMLQIGRIKVKLNISMVEPKCTAAQQSSLSLSLSLSIYIYMYTKWLLVCSSGACELWSRHGYECLRLSRFSWVKVGKFSGGIYSNTHQTILQIHHMAADD